VEGWIADDEDEMSLNRRPRQAGQPHQRHQCGRANEQQLAGKAGARRPTAGRTPTQFGIERFEHMTSTGSLNKVVKPPYQ
jgi:hypothetical protein